MKLLALTFCIALWVVPIARTHNSPAARKAINYYWCGKANASCPAGRKAWQVAGCETGYTYSPWARNGQYLGLFQMGYYARSKYGHSNNVWGQARAAHRYYVDSGWSPWSCA